MWVKPKTAGCNSGWSIDLVRLCARICFLAMVLVASAIAEEDPFSDTGDSFAEPEAAQVEDRFESFNRSMFSFNEKADRYVLKPVAKAYQTVTPKFLDEGITNVFNNLGDVDTFFNSLLQGKFHNAVVTLNRVIYNTVFGLGGFFDVATSFGLINDEEDFGQTLAVWGYEESSYLVLPFLGPSTVRDFGGFVVDNVSYDPLDEIENLNDDERYMLMALNLIDKRADLLAAEHLMVGGDPYVFLRNAYLQNRNFLIKDGEIEDNFADEEFEELEGF